MAAQVVLGDIASKTPLGFLRINGHVSVRGRRGLPLSGTQVVQMMSDEEK